ncbi:hypothetical protein [Desulfovibrio oxyclinae]|uniref:hypothetical protein n=1 Tax=Desulfovibrio oxyclinae TaxID=63560 RepID=UPI0003828330|nr:hypothetical protein [Desulfovibrio oxyclinae]
MAKSNSDVDSAIKTVRKLYSKKDEVTLDVLLFNLSPDKSQALELLHKILNEPLLSDEEYNWLKRLSEETDMG